MLFQRTQNFARLIITLSFFALSGCLTSHDKRPTATLFGQASQLQKVTVLFENQPQKVESAQLMAWPVLDATNRFASANMLVTTKKNGLLVLNQQGDLLSQLKGDFAQLDHRIVGTNMVVASVEANLQQAIIHYLDTNNGVWSSPLIVPKPTFKIENVCLYQDAAQHQFVFLIGEEGLGEQWLVAEHAALLSDALLVRQLSLPPNSQYCAVDDASHTLYVNEENVGLWAYAAHAEAELSRQAVLMVKPFGNMAKSVAGIARVQSQMLLVDSESQALHHWNLQDDHMQAATAFMSLATLKAPENIHARLHQKGLDILVQDKTGIHFAQLPMQASMTTSSGVNTTPTSDVELMPEVTPLIQTDPIPSLGDAADDPAIWLHPQDITQSLVLGTDKQGGLAVYDLQGREQQYLPVGRLNNVDIRPAFELNGALIDIAVASNRDHNSLHLFSIDRKTGRVETLGEQATSIEDIYGLCMFKDKQNRFYAIVNDKNGRFEQYDLTVFDRHIQATLVREFNVATQPEGCVADDESEQLFIGEEAKAVWTLNANADAATTMTQVIGINKKVHADIEGIAYYRGKYQHYLVISSQGNDSYAVLEARPPYRYRGSFRIGINAQRRIDGASETDGLEVTAADLSGQQTGIWRLGMLVVQDGRKRMPTGQQNFKYVPWTSIAEALRLE